MIYIGLTETQKKKEIQHFVSKQQIKKVYVFFFKKFKPQYKVDCEIEYIEYSDIIMYKYFYRLLEEIDKSSLIVIDGCLRTRKRNDLTYNCLAHYLNQTEHRLVFEFLPFIEDKEDMMILFDFENNKKLYGQKFDYVFLQTENIKIRPQHIKLKNIFVAVDENETTKYEEQKEKLFEKIEATSRKDPDIVPRELQLIAGNFKKKAIQDDLSYIARNARFKMGNVDTYKTATKKKYHIIDTHYRRLDMIDFIKQTKNLTLNYLATSLSIDTVITNDYNKWIARLEAVYAKANLYR